jgi:phytanoyl-CoA hydroxylase
MIKTKTGQYPKFHVGNELLEEHLAFFKENGFIHFENFFTDSEIGKTLDALYEVQQRWVAEGREKINGVPIVYGHDDKGNKIVHRFAFTNLASPYIHDMVTSDRIKMLIQLLGRKGRIGEHEKDGAVVNQYINAERSKMKQMGWHTDSPRDLFYGQKISPMLNVGIYLSDSKAEQGGLRVLAGTHNQNLMKLLFRKPLYISNKPDKKEIRIDARAGDLTIHHGHMWHRVATAPQIGQLSKRIVMYMPIICGKYQPKDDYSTTPFYLKLRGFAKK